jgi:putative DNA primase/helicase
MSRLPMDRRPIEEVLAEFWDERAGILNWLIDGRATISRGPDRAAEIADATAEYREEMDPIEGFVGMRHQNCAADR